MSKLNSAGKVGILCTAMGIAFWGGRTSSSGASNAKESDDKRPTRSAERSQATAARTAKSNGPGAGGEAVLSALQLRDFFKGSGGNYQKGQAVAEAALSKMNGDELSKLVADLANAQASTPGYSYTLEISTACARWAQVDPDAAIRFVLSAKQSSFRSAAIGSILGGIAKTDPDLARAKLASISDTRLRSAARSGLMSALSTTQPDAWVEMVKDDPSSARNWGITGIVSEWAVDDPVAAARRLAQLPKNMQQGAAASIAKIWASKDSAAASAWANSLADTTQRNQALGAIAGGIAAENPEGALAALANLPPAARRAGLGSVFQTLADQDFDSAIARASGLSDPADQRTAFQMLMGRDPSGNTYFARSADQLAGLVEKLPTGALREQALEQLGGQLASASREESERILQGYPDAERQKLQGRMLQSMAYYDPARAMEIYDSLPPGKTESYTFQNILSYLSTQDPDAALKIAMERKLPGEQSQALGSVFSNLARNDPEGAQRKLAELPAGPGRTAALRSLASGWAEADPTAALQWSQSLQGADRSSAMFTVLPTVARTDPESAAAAIGPLLANPPEKDPEGNISSATSQIVSYWVKQDAAAASNWVNSLPEGNTKDNTVQNLAYSWCRQDSDSAGKWIDSMPDGKTRNNAVQAMVSVTTERDPATAMKWADSVDDDNQRGSMVGSIINTWSRNDPTAARAAAEKADIPEDRRKRLLEQLDRKASGQ